MLNQFLSKVIWVDFKSKRVLHEQQIKVKKIPYLCQIYNPRITIERVK